jgi:hypothetical protein
MKKNDDFDFKPIDKKEQTVKIPTDILNHSDSIALDLEQNLSETEIVLGRNSRCVSVDTFSFAPEGRKEKKRVFCGGSDLYYKNIGGNEYLIFSHHNVKLLYNSGFDVWTANYSSEKMIGRAKPIKDFEIKLCYNHPRDIDLIKDFLEK